MNRPDNKEGFYAAGLFFIWPFLAVVSALKNFRKPWAKNLFWAFCAFYGLTFFVDFNSGRDIVSYVERYQSLHQITNVSTSDYIDDYKDPFIPLVSVVLSRLTDSQPVLTLVYGILFGFFFSRNMWYVMERLKGQLMPITILLLVCLFMVNPIWEINGIRMWLAAHIFLYGLLPYLCEGKKGGLIVSAGSMLVHFSFAMPVAVLASYMLLGNLLTAYYIFFISTFFISEINLTVFNDFIQLYAPESLQDNTASYRGEAYVENTRAAESTSNWYALLYGTLRNWTVMGFLTILFFKGRSFFSEHKGWMNLFSFVLLYYGAANLISTLPSGGRFITVANFMAFALIILYLQNRPKEKLMKWYIWAATPALLLYVVVTVRIGMLSTGATAILGNPIVALFTAGQDMSFEQFLRMIF